MLEIRRLDVPEGGPEDPFLARLLTTLNADADAAGISFSREDIRLEAILDGAYAGGLEGKLGKAFLFVELLAVEPFTQGKGVGRALLECAEDIARESGAHGVWLDTFTFQAPEFYRRCGYSEFGRIPDYTHGEDRVFLAKRLDGVSR